MEKPKQYGVSPDLKHVRTIASVPDDWDGVASMLMTSPAYSHEKNMGVVHRLSSQAILLEKLEAGVAHFWFERADGELREAFGTLNASIIPPYKREDVQALLVAVKDVVADYSSAGEITVGIDTGLAQELDMAVRRFEPKEKKESPKKEGVQTYYDIQVQGWRSYTVANLIFVY